MEWHRATETPKPDTEVLAEVKGFKHNRFIVLKWSEKSWWQHIPRMNDIMPSDGWVGTQGLFVIRWAYIDEKDLALTLKDLELLHTFLCAVKNNKQGCFTFTRLSDEQYQEVLRRFNEQRKK